MQGEGLFNGFSSLLLILIVPYSLSFRIACIFMS